MLSLYVLFLDSGFKDSANRAQYKTSLLVFTAEMQPILSKDSANRAQYKTSLLVFIAEVQPILSKDSANRAEGKMNSLILKAQFNSTHPYPESLPQISQITQMTDVAWSP